MLEFRIRETIEDLNQFGEISIINVDSNVRHKGVVRSLMEFAEKLANNHKYVDTCLASGIGRKDEAHQFDKEFGYLITKLSYLIYLHIKYQ